MKSLEDKIKERLEGYESRLPEGDLAEFKTLLDREGEGKQRVTPIAWIAPVAFAAAAALAVMVSRHPEMETVTVVDSYPMVAEVVELEAPENDMPDAVVDAVVAVSPNAGGMKSSLYSQAVAPASAEDYESITGIQVDEYQEEADIPKVMADGEQLADADSASYDDVTFLPFSPDVKRPISTKVGNAAAGVLGGTSAVILTGLLPSIASATGIFDDVPTTHNVGHGPGSTYASPEDITVENGKSGNDSHSYPLHAGLSLRVPMNDRWSLTTGVDYSVYLSRIGYMGSSGKRQKAQYIGVPVRADYTLARNRWIDVYLGAGASADFCVSAYEDGNKVAKDGVGLSLIGGGGFQFNMNRSLGLFVDPMFSWDLFSNSRVLETYRTEYPFMFSVSGGIRVTLDVKDR